MEHPDDHACLQRAQAHSIDVLQQSFTPILPSLSTLSESRSTLLQKLPDRGLGVVSTTSHLLNKIAPALNASSISPNYYGFIIGGITPAARVAETVVSTYDQNPQVHLPGQTIASNVEDKALRLLMDLFHFDQTAWSGVFTTGATASNVLGLACGREYIINERIKIRLGQDSVESLGSLGLLKACRVAGIEDIHIFTTMAHSSLYKASSIVGLGRSCIQEVGNPGDEIALNLRELEEKLQSNQHRGVSIVVVSCGEVNTGLFATQGSDLRMLRAMCDKHGAWLHVDGAFGIFARAFEGLTGFESIAQGAQGLELADSIAGDGHKLLSVPYDCGFFFTRHPNIAQQVCQNPNAAYLNTKTPATDTVQSPLNIGLENSRRFRGLPVYATLIAYGRDGYVEMLKRQVQFARSVAKYLYHHDAFELLPRKVFDHEVKIDQDVFIIVLFRAKDKALNDNLVNRVNASSKMYVSGTVWQGCAASRIAVSNWQVHPHRDIAVVKGVFEDILKDWSQEI